MQTTNPYEQIRARLRAHIAQLNVALVDVDRIEAMERGAQLKAPSNAQQSKRFRPAINAGASWAEAVDAILRDAKQPMTVAQIISALEAQGRTFPPNSRKDAPIRSVMSRRGQKLHWIQKNGKWSKHKESAA